MYPTHAASVPMAVPGVPGGHGGGVMPPALAEDVGTPTHHKKAVPEWLKAELARRAAQCVTP
eukprot:7424750-Pyramimonas_sp.AAC.1